MNKNKKAILMEFLNDMNSFNSLIEATEETEKEISDLGLTYKQEKFDDQKDGNYWQCYSCTATSKGSVCESCGNARRDLNDY